jgi:hypothetical protein
VVSSIPKVVINSKWKRQGAGPSDFVVLPFLLKCKQNNECDNLKTRNNYSLHVQEVVLCRKMNQRWLSINLLYKTFFNWTIQKYFEGTYLPSQGFELGIELGFELEIELGFELGIRARILVRLSLLRKIFTNFLFGVSIWRAIWRSSKLLTIAI